MARPTNHYSSRAALETRVDYVEGKLDAAIIDLKESINETRKDLKESRKDFKESMLQMESRHNEAIKDNKEAMLQIENRHQANFTDLKASLDRFVAKTESSRRWSIGLIITIAIAAIGYILTNGIQIQF